MNTMHFKTSGKRWFGLSGDKLRLTAGLMLGLSISAVLFFSSSNYFEQDFIQKERERGAAPHAAAVNQIINEYLEVAHSVAGLFAASENVSRVGFNAFFGHVMSRQYAIQALEWIPRVPAGERAKYEEQAVRNGYPDFQITERNSEGKMVRAGLREEYFPVYFVEPYEGNEADLGFDLGSSPARREALERARDTGELVATKRIKLVQDKGQDFGFLAFIPLYSSVHIPESVEQRRKQHVGFALGVFHIGAIIELTMREAEGLRNFDIYVFDVNGDPGEQLLYHRMSPNRDRSAEPASYDQVLVGAPYTASLDVGGRNWTIVYKFAPGGNVGQYQTIPWFISVSAFVFTILSLAYVRASQNRTRLIEHEVAERSKDLLAANDALEAEMDQRKCVERQLTQAQKMEAIGQLTGGIAHDFNNLLMIIDGYARRTLSNIGDVEIAGRSLEEVLAATERAANLTKQLLVFSRRQIMDKRVFPVADAVRELKGLLDHSVGERYGFEFKIADKKVCVHTDSGELSQAILNLAINARDAMPEGGKITIGVQVIDVDAEFIESDENMPEGRYVDISVTDKGCGMDETTMEHIFEPFLTTKEQGQGTGLGLSMVYGFARQSGGKLEVISAVGKGTTVHIYLPVVKRPPTLISIQEQTEHRGHGETILLVEDDNRLLELIHDMLCDLGYKVFVAGNGFEALEVDGEMEKPIDLLLSDVVMPALGGFELYEILKEKRPDMKAVFMSGYPKRGAGKVKIPENVPFLQKPVAPGQLAQIVWSEISRTQFVPSHAI